MPYGIHAIFNYDGHRTESLETSSHQILHKFQISFVCNHIPLIRGFNFSAAMATQLKRRISHTWVRKTITLP